MPRLSKMLPSLMWWSSTRPEHLTLGAPKVVEIATAKGTTEEGLLKVTASIEKGSEHPLAKAILERGGELKVPVAKGFQNIEGQGARAIVSGKEVVVGNSKLIVAKKIDWAGLEGRLRSAPGRGAHSRSCGTGQASLSG